MARWIHALSLGCVLALTGTALAGDGSDAKGNQDVIVRLDAILRRLDAIEQRLAKLEDAHRLVRDWWVDDRGIMRTETGRPIGVWGIESPYEMELQR